MHQETRYFSMAFSQQLVNEPILHNISTKFSVVFNITSANVNDARGSLHLSLRGEGENLLSALDYLRERGVEIDELHEPVEV